MTSRINSRHGDVSYDVKVWSIRTYKGANGTTYTVRWSVAGKARPETFKTKALAESFRAQLLSAARRGEAFDSDTGRPISMLSTEPETPSWYEHATTYMDMKWRRAAAESRASIADALATVTPAFISVDGRPTTQALRRALYGWVFNTAERKNGPPPPDLRKTVHWLERNTFHLSALDDPSVLRSALETLATRQDGQTASTNTFVRKRAVLYNALEYAVELGYFPTNPLSRVKWTTPKATEAVDPRVLVDRKRAEALLAAVAAQGDLGPHLVAFFGCMYYAAMRPAEVVELREADLVLPEEDSGWGDIHLNASAPAVAKRWTDSGQRREARQLKHRAREEVRPVPCHPRLVQLLRAHLERFGTAPDGRIFRGRYYNRRLSESVYGRCWQNVRVLGLSEIEAASPMARRPYDLRHACVTTWLNAGVDPAQVAAWAGHSVAVLLRVYIRCVAGRDEIARKRIERALEEDGSDGTEGLA
ncbi:tyrosine-type recombinase/integrase [Actinopolymorpha sp. B11F2]|uniref:tyrosine-type recombinase/integrase n=1 Tax=Actinopolymorpha sp. B11F2 TaxID=3160862 RepID=UPI0032E428A6